MIRVLKGIISVLRDGARAARAAKTKRIIEWPQLASWEQDNGKRPAASNDNIGGAQALSFAGSVGFKTASAVVPMLLNWPEEVVALDEARRLH